ncbi:MAG: type II toxin-antitoxin system RelE/ParE family toxin [Nitrospirales bacterium]
MPEYELSIAAQDDLNSIARYTVNKWGLNQAKRYEGLLVKGFQEISKGRLPPRVFLSHRHDLLFTHCEHHYVFYATRERQPPLILAVFHENMDLMQRLKERLS